MKRYFGGFMLLFVIGCGPSDEQKNSNPKYQACAVRIQQLFSNTPPKSVKRIVSQQCDEWLE